MREGLARFIRVDTGRDTIQNLACCRIEAVRRDRVSSIWSALARSLRKNVLGAFLCLEDPQTELEIRAGAAQQVMKELGHARVETALETMSDN